MKADTVTLKWHDAPDEPPVYSCKVAEHILEGVPFFANAFSGRFAESASRKVKIVHPAVTKSNVVLWLKFRLWCVNMNGADPRGGQISPYLAMLADYLGDAQFSAQYFAGVNIIAKLTSYSHHAIDSTVGAYGNYDPYSDDSNDSNDSSDDNYEITTTHSQNFGDPIVIKPGLYTREQIISTICAEINLRYRSEYKRDLVLQDENGLLKVCRREYDNNDAKEYDCFPGTQMINFHCWPYGHAVVEEPRQRPVRFCERCYIFNRLDNDNTFNSKFKIFFRINFSPDILGTMGGSYNLDTKGVNFAYWKVNQRNYAQMLLNIIDIDLLVRIPFVNPPEICCNGEVPPRVGKFPKDLTDEIAIAVSNHYVLSLAKKPGIGFQKLREFALSEGQLRDIAEHAWSADSTSVCKMLQVPKKSINAAAKKSFGELADYSTSVLRQKYKFTDLYEFDDAELNRLHKRAAELREKLRYFESYINRCGAATLERIGRQFDDIEIDNPAALLDELARIEIAYEERYKKLVSNAKKAELSTDYSKYDYLCRK